MHPPTVAVAPCYGPLIWTKLVSALTKVLRIVEANPRKFKITQPELYERKSFIAATRATIQQIKDEISSPEVKAKLEDLSRKVRILFTFPDTKSYLRQFDNAMVAYYQIALIRKINAKCRQSNSNLMCKMFLCSHFNSNPIYWYS